MPIRKPRTSKHGRRYNWHPDLPDQRDFLFSEQMTTPLKLPKTVDLRDECPPVFDQGKIGSCTGNALAAAIDFIELRELGEKKNKTAAKNAVLPEIFGRGGRFSAVSRLFIYYNERAIEGTVDQDGGAQLRDGIKVLAQFGACRESLWKYTATNVLKKPATKAFAEAKAHCVSTYMSLRTLDEMKQCLALGFPVVFGFSVYESFESPDVARTGLMPMPEEGESMLGGHAVMAVGYDDGKEQLIVRNSWGAKWGDGGYFRMPYEYVEGLKLARDFWTVRG